MGSCGSSRAASPPRDASVDATTGACQPGDMPCASTLECCSLLCVSGRCVSSAPPSDSDSGDSDSGDSDSEGGCVFDLNAGTLCQFGQFVPCPNNTATTLSGKVYDPAGKNPLYHAIVSMPRDVHTRVPPIVVGSPTCACDEYVDSAYTSTTTDPTGSFTLSNVLVGQNVPVVIQVGKWRRVVSVPQMHACVDNVLPVELSHLPRNQGEGDIPQMAILTGRCDELPCLLTSIGLDANEFTGPDGAGRVHVYRGAGPGPDLEGGGGGVAGDCSGDAGACPLWSTKQQLERYDMVLLGCECGDNDQTKPDKGPMHDWLAEGGKLLLTHYQSTWLRNGPTDLRGVANWSSEGGASGSPLRVDWSWSESLDFARWLGALRALDGDGGLPIDASEVTTSVASVNPPTVQWAFDPSSAPASPKLLSFETMSLLEAGAPIADYCGEAVVTDIHAGGGGVPRSSPVPASCPTGDTTAEQKALEFAFFNMWSRICEFNHTPPPAPAACTFGSSACDQCVARHCCAEVLACKADSLCSQALDCAAACEMKVGALGACLPGPCGVNLGQDSGLADLGQCAIRANCLGSCGLP
jgi:hypothetical protein